MKDPSFAIRETYAVALTGTVFHKGMPVPVYDGKADDKASTPYIILGNQTFTPRDSICTFDSECSLIVIVCTSFPATDRGNKRYADEISNQITEIMLPAPASVLNLSPDFECLAMFIEGGNTSESQDQTNQYYEKAIRFNHIVQQL